MGMDVIFNNLVKLLNIVATVNCLEENVTLKWTPLYGKHDQLIYA